ncbi:UDP-N-acetylmuramyl-tripeptide synthetase [Candidatus Nardonella dryophthoridicola]|uniref:UDP-N-acetylmuramyl-tripeptide synthetase n=1 Tax=Candidatus Nardonella dryophthoridicola TaxID=1971485 RepID=UPI001AD87DA9|nr:UDP-N-acetylmuramyl-tripeptide synthetase [Candidatus Nardonella dryophthoridicola]QTJ62923.1 UDP-N-acetylmuramyl-tripeptide synthetase [Candidatus Nardonella dryophthoridicola]
MNIKNILKNYININNIPDIYISGISYDLDNIKYGNAFFLINNYKNSKINNLIDKLISKGVFIIIKEATNYINNGIFFFKNNILILLIYDLKKKISKISIEYYKKKNKNTNYNLIGITGTNGKTTISFFICQLIKLLNKKPYIVSTLGNGNIDNLYKTEYTTDLPFKFFKNLYSSIDEYYDFIISEITSHSLDQYRINGANFNICIFTNISHDHLDYHKNIFNYKISKLKLFNDYYSKYNIVNYDDNLGKEIYNNFKEKTFIVTTKNISDFEINKFKFWLKLIYVIKKKKFNIIKISSNFGNGYFKTNIYQNFNIKNILISISCLLLLGFNIFDILNVINYLKLPLGRFNTIKKNNFNIIIDYAHTPESIYKLLFEIKKKYRLKKICSIFGFGGNRDSYKRIIIYNIILKFSDYFILTSDNSRNERFKNIINFVKKNNKIKIIYNRESAIKYSLNKYKNSVIVIIGKGHENYQILYNNKKIFHSDLYIVKKYINND